MRPSPKAREVAIILALLATTVMAVHQFRGREAAVEQVFGLTPNAARAVSQDQLIGRALALRDIAPASVPEDTRHMFLWVVDLDRCFGCFDSVAQWARLELLLNYRFRLLLVGAPNPQVKARLRVLSKTSTAIVTREEARRLIGNTLPSTKLLLNEEGVVLLADSRSSGQNCGWNFEAQVGALVGALPARAIRGQ